jgi:site-specific recombinase XerC
MRKHPRVLSGSPRFWPTVAPASRRHTTKTYRQGFDAVAVRMVENDRELSAMLLSDIITAGMRRAFARYAETHEAASIQRCWSAWNVLCALLFASELIPANPRPMVGRPKIAKTLPKTLAPNTLKACSMGSMTTASSARAIGLCVPGR